MLFCASATAKQNDIVISTQGEIFKNFTVGIYEDSSASLSFSQIQELKAFAQHSNAISKGYSKSVFWVKFKLTNALDSGINYHIKFTENFIDKINFYIQEKGNFYQEKKLGVGYFSEGRKNELKKPVVSVQLDSGQSKIIYFSLSSIYPNMTSFYILDSQSLNKYDQDYKSIYSLFFGGIIALLLYNVVIYLFSKDKSYLYYVIYAFLFLLWQLMLNGFFPFNTFNSTQSFYLASMITPLWIAFLIFFSIEILDVKKMSRKIHSGLKYTAYTFLLLTFSCIFSLQHSFIIFNGIVIFLFPYLLYVGVKSYRLGNKTALFFLIAQVFFISMAILFGALAYGYLEYNSLTRHSIILGSFIEMILFSLALAYRIKKLQNDKISLVNEANLKLDKRVYERTKELEESKEKLKELANRDPLTGLYNRRFLYSISQKLILLAKREGKPLSIVMFDIDEFKKINDTYGHSIGDDVIKVFSTHLNKSRASDISARIGGEEFVLLLPNTSQEDAYEIANKIRVSIEKIKFCDENNSKFNFTVSAGVSSLQQEDSEIEVMLHRADKGLYEAKQTGRNRIILYEP